MPANFKCPHCDALYRVVKMKADPETAYSQVICRACGGPLPAREGGFVCKYFLLRERMRRVA